MHSRMLLVAVSLSAVRTLEVDIISTSAPFLAVCGSFRCSVQHFSRPSMMKSSSSSRAHANWTVMLCQHRDRISSIVTNNNKTTKQQPTQQTQQTLPTLLLELTLSVSFPCLLCSICSYQSSLTALVTDSSTHSRWLKMRLERKTLRTCCRTW